MTSERRLTGLARTIGFFSWTVLLGTFVYAGTASAQCGPAAGKNNTACGTGALASDTTGIFNSAFGYNALRSNTTGNYNTASGANALLKNTTGRENTAAGEEALRFNTTGRENTASGLVALLRNTTGNYNTASGFGALWGNTTGNYNIALGHFAGAEIGTGSNNIDIGNGGAGTGNESNTIRIGVQGTQTKTYIAGINTDQINIGNVVEVNGNGRLGIAMSSARYKRDIHDMGSASAGLMKLRPVTFRYKNDPSGTLEYGLVAEEVQRVYPNLVTYGADGKLQSVRYLEFTALLLNELQKQSRNNKELSQENHELRSEMAQVREAQVREHAAQQREIDALKHKDASINALSERLTALERQVQTASSQGLRSLASNRAGAGSMR
jgi:trimeric autotransporter adhesin